MSLLARIRQNAHAPTKGQRGFSLTEFTASLAIAGTLGTAVAPQFIDTVESAERVSLQQARKSLNTAVQMAHAVGIMRQQSTLIIEGKPLALHNGYPLANADEFSKLMTIEGFPLETKNAYNIALYSPYRTYCLVYTQSLAPGVAATLSDIKRTQNGACVD